jgi:hypothetical protein
MTTTVTETMTETVTETDCGYWLVVGCGICGCWCGEGES